MPRQPPPFPFENYDFPIDRLRHWIELQGNRVFSVQAAREATGLDASGFLLRLRDKGEVEHVATALYRKTERLWLVDFEATAKHNAKFSANIRALLYVTVEHDLRALQARLLDESTKLSSVEVRRCANELGKILDKVFQ